MPDYSNDGSKPLYITLHSFGGPAPESRALYTSGDTIRGIVCVDPKLRPQRIDLLFKCHSEVEIPQSNRDHNEVCREESDLFCHTVELFSAPERSYDIVTLGIAQDGKVQIPFTFEFPSTVELEPKGRTPERAGFECQPGYPLPPSYTFYRMLNYETQRVEYYLEAAAFTSSKFDAEIQTRQMLNFQPFSLTPLSTSPDTIPVKPFRVELMTHKLNHQYETQEGTRHRIKRYFSGSECPVRHASFELSARVPNTVYLNSLLPLEFSITHLDRSRELPDPPSIFLRRIRIVMVEMMQARVPGRDTWRADEVEFDLEQSKHRELLDRQCGVPGTLLHDGMMLDDFRPLVLEDLAPAFKSYRLSMGYAIEVKVWIECAGDKHSFVVCSGPIKILPELRTLISPNGDDGLVGVKDAEGTEANERESPPPYAPPPYKRT
ncbi:hypothetical protein BDV95DRAFT_612524 [Massariosphaeria phaeospora]|uniref:Arrestin-like N-terminal domain-containing protein n=1 Tax=Massariosphaeria phaeospora TaxID=100035 RepID=A0A7C8I1M6_9PLEO|nr:hypothetical protein BDV95DRAFT_612524 [Massariosphaeria phaeospora]